MGRGTAYHEHAIMLETYTYTADTDDTEEIEHILQDVFADLRSTIAHALGDVAIRREWLENNLQQIAENERMLVAFEYEDTYTQIVARPKCYKVFMREEKADAKGYDTTGNSYRNAAGIWIAEALVPYDISQDARRLFRKILLSMGNLDEKGEHYKNFSMRTSAWTSAALEKGAFKAKRRNAAKAA